MHLNEHSSPSWILREASSDAHVAAEATPILSKLATGYISDHEYCYVIAGFAFLFDSILHDIETLPGGPQILALTHIAERAQQARNDALHLGVKQRLSALRAPFIRSPASAFGAVYVLEGARLGGAMIGARLRSAGRRVGAVGYRFFDLKHEPVAQDWRTFKSHLDRLLVGEDQLEEAIVAARSVFELTATVFAEPKSLQGDAA